MVDWAAGDGGGAGGEGMVEAVVMVVMWSRKRWKGHAKLADLYFSGRRVFFRTLLTNTCVRKELKLPLLPSDSIHCK